RPRARSSATVSASRGRGLTPAAHSDCSNGEVVTMSRRAPEITRTRAAGPDHQVVTVQGGKGSYRRRPCAKCPWRVDATGEFPADAFRHSAETAYDMATET
ncbi:hypothetical protein MTR_1498s0010, partial [Medicago truncatula]